MSVTWQTIWLLLQQYVSSPVCTPSRYACLTGRYASRARNASFRRSMARTGQSVVGWNTKITPDDATLPKALQQAGYRTGMVGKNHVVDVPGLRKIGYQEDPNDPRVKASLKENQQTVQRAIRRCGFDYAGSIYNNNPDGNGPRALAVHNLDWITQAGLDFIERFNAKQREHGKRIVTTDPSARFSHISLIPGGGGAEAASTGKYPGYYDADQLYDLERDPREQVNLAKDPHYAGPLKEMQRELRNDLDDLPGGFGDLKPSTGYREE